MIGLVSVKDVSDTAKSEGKIEQDHLFLLQEKHDNLRSEQQKGFHVDEVAEKPS